MREGDIRGGSNANEVWTDNLSDLNVESGATFFGVEENIRVDVITGTGTVSSGHPNGRYETFTLGVANGSGTFDGVVDNGTTLTPNTPGNYTKVGTGTQTLNGLNTYTGDTRIEDGSLIISATSQLTFAPAGNGQSNQVAGGGAETGALVFDGALNINLGNADTTGGNSWLLID